MASVFNSQNAVQDLNASAFSGRWEDIQSYTSVINTLEVGSDTSGVVYLDWLNMDDDDVPEVTASALVSDSFNFAASQTITKQFDTRTRWFRLRIEGTGASLNQISTNYKKAPTEIKITDNCTNIVNVNLGTNNNNSLYTILTDLSGLVLGTTNEAHTTGQALYTHLADASGASLATTNNNRDLVRTIGTDVSFIFSSDGENAGYYGSMIVEKNRFRLPKSTIPFKDGDTVRFAMGGLNDTDFSVAAAFANPATPAGVLKTTGTVRFRETETSHIQFEILVNKDMSEWFDPNIGFTNFDTSQFINFNTMSALNHLTAVGSNGYAYLHEVSAGTVPSVDDYYAAFADQSGFNVSGAGLSLSPGIYPMDLRFFRGSLEDDTSNIHIVSYDISAASDPAESLAVALRDYQNNNLGSTGAGVTSYLYHQDRTTNSNILFMVDTCLIGTNTVKENLKSTVEFIRKIAAEIATDYGTAPTTAVVGYSDGVTFPVFSSGAPGPTHVHGSVLKGLDTSTDTLDWQIGDYNSITTIDTDAHSNYWKALNDYSNLENVETSMGSVFSSALDAIVLFSYGDSSASAADRLAFDACSNFFNGLDKIAITYSGNNITELLSFTGTTDNIYYLPKTEPNLDNCTGYITTLARRLAGIKHVGHNALMVHTTDVCGHSQAATRAVTDAQHGDVALYYALSDSCGTLVDTTKSTTETTGLNAMYATLVTKVNAQGTALSGPSTVNGDRPLHITFDAANIIGKMFDFNISGHLVTTNDLNNNNVNLKHLGIANETPTTIWLKIYDMSVGYYLENSGALLNATTGLYDSSAYALQDKLVYNFAVPGLDYRDLEFGNGVLFSEGMYMVTSTNYRYDTYDYPPGNKHIYVHGSYEDISSTTL